MNALKRGKRFFGTQLPGCDPTQLKGKLIVLEGADGSGRSTQIDLLKNWLENLGYGTVNVGLKRSTLVSEELDLAQQGNILSHTTRGLFYATDFADQLENNIIPALKAGFVVLADRYIYTLKARDIVRGADRDWVKSLYSIAIVPDAVFYLRVSPQQLVERNFKKNATLNYWESGMDIGLSRDMFESFMKYQRLMQAEFRRMQEEYGFEVINGNRSTRAIANELRAKVQAVLEARDMRPTQRQRAQRELAAALNTLRLLVKEVGGNYLASLQADVARVDAAVKMLPTDEPSNRQQLAELRAMLRAINALDLKPQKGRRRDLKELDRVIANLNEVVDSW